MRNAVQIVEDDYAAQGLGVELLPFFYCAEFPTLGGAPQDVTTIVAVDRDSDFIWFDTRICAYNGSPTLRSRGYVNLRLDTQGRNLTEQNLGNVAPFGGVVFGVGGQAMRPFVFHDPVVLPARSALVVRFTSLVESFTDLHVAFHGMKAVTVRR